ncbi:GNAT family N-acetyltransferase [Actinospica durhamensis]|uniref:GNAT family N-acetyltransferase n=1 Tax=Actinospica durhamensis TaxID=1508375 RepID=A0A941IT41_9ACTN|nr:GNAT family N-acetyltransferase [Actinospica durhamensis]MBR7833936.1 GNAT family N-acetyltransferase [Actinospica durhamensis]
MLLRDVELGDVEAYVRMRCDPVMMAELGGPLPREGIEAKVARDAGEAARDTSWIKMIVPDQQRPEVVAGNVVLWRHDPEGADGQHGAVGEPISEIGWMVLPEFQGRGLGSRAVALLLERARADGRWGLVHAYPGATNAASNGICRKLGFTLVGRQRVEFAGRLLQTCHWTIQT